MLLLLLLLFLGRHACGVDDAVIGVLSLGANGGLSGLDMRVRMVLIIFSANVGSVCSAG